MKIVALIPFWEDYESNEFRIKKIAGRFLLSYTLEKLNKIANLDNIYVYSSNKNFASYIESNILYEYLQRPKFLDSSDVSIEQIISEFLHSVDADIILLVHPTSPLLKVQSITKCIDSVSNDGYDSAFTAVKYQKLAWYKEKSLNYDLSNDIPKLKDVEPVYIEQSSLYVFNKTSFLKNKHRISERFKIHEIDQVEGLEVRNKMDFELMELIINSGMYKEQNNESF